MAGNDEPEVKDVERIEVTPAGADAEDVDDETEETDADSSQQETEGDEDESEDESEKPDELVKHPNTPPSEEGEGDDDGDDDDLAVIEGETPRERGLRLENKKLRTKLRQERKDDLDLGGSRQARSTELDQGEKEIIGKYKPEEVQALKEVFPVLAKEMGFVRKDELETSTFHEKSQEVLDTFLDKHPEYLPENDKDGTLWDSFKSEFGLYKPPTNPKDFAKIFEKVHRDVFGIKPGKGTLSTVNAQREKTKVASHAGASSAPAAPKAKPATANASGVRVDMLKGFSDEEREELFGGDE